MNRIALLWVGVSSALLLTSAVASDSQVLVAGFTSLENCQAAPWPDRGGAAPTSRIKISVAQDGAEHPSVLRIDYEFPSESCTQVKVDIALPPCENYQRLVFACRGDASGNLLQVWTGEQARGWHGVGAVPLDFSNWRPITLALDDNYTALAHTLRFIIVRRGKLGRHTVLLDDVRFVGPVEKSLPPDFSVGPKATEPVPFRRQRRFALERRVVGDRTVLLVDGQPLMCVLDAAPKGEYLQMARAAGVNCFALDLYWRDLEPLEGFDNWSNLERFVRWLGDAGFAVAMLVNIHQPRWLLAKCPDEPLCHGTIYPRTILVRQHFTRFLHRFLPRFAGMRNVIIIGVSAGGEADAHFPEVPGTLSPWRRSPALLADFRQFLRDKYHSDERWRRAWELGDEATIAEAVPPKPLGAPNEQWLDFRASWHDWRQFIDQWWLGAVDWQAKIVRRLMPGRLIMVRFGWPVFQCENVFLVREAEDVDMVQCKDAVPTWEAATPWFLVSRTALYHGAVRGTQKINFPEVDVGHNRGRPTSEDMVKYLPPIAPWAGAFWYYRGLHASFIDGLSRAFANLSRAMLRPTQPRVAVFYGQKYANWCQNHTNYANEAALAGAARVLGEAGIPFTVVSEYALGCLREMKAVILADNPILPREAARALEDFAASGGAVVIEDTTRRDLSGQKLRLHIQPALKLPFGFFASVQPRGSGLTLTAQQQETARAVVSVLRDVLEHER